MKLFYFTCSIAFYIAGFILINKASKFAYWTNGHQQYRNYAWICYFAGILFQMGYICVST